jgi:hypothetical protein
VSLRDELRSVVDEAYSDDVGVPTTLLLALLVLIALPALVVLTPLYWIGLVARRAGRRFL